jgi:hypothetical protein
VGSVCALCRAARLAEPALSYAMPHVAPHSGRTTLVAITRPAAVPRASGRRRGLCGRGAGRPDRRARPCRSAAARDGDQRECKASVVPSKSGPRWRRSWPGVSASKTSAAGRAGALRSPRQTDGGWGYLKPSVRPAANHVWANSEVFFPFELAWKSNGQTP